MNIIQSPTIPSINIGGRVFTDLENLLIFKFKISGANPNSTLRLSGESSGYQVPADSQLRILAIQLFIESVSAGGAALQTLYADNDVGVVSATAFTNAVADFSVTMTNAAASQIPEYSMLTNFVVPTTKYPAISGLIGVNGNVFGYLEAV